MLNLDDESRKDQRNALIVQDGCSCWLPGYPAKAQTRKKTASCWRRFLLSFQKPGRFHTHNSKGFTKACQDLQWTHVKNAPHRSDADKIPERVVPRVTEGTPTARVQSGRREQWWDRAMECFSYLRNVHDKMPDGKTASNKLCGVTFARPLIPFGAKVSYKPIS